MVLCWGCCNSTIALFRRWRKRLVVISLCWLSSLGCPSESELMSDMSMTGNGFPTFDMRLELLGWERRRGEKMRKEGARARFGSGNVKSSKCR